MQQHFALQAYGPAGTCQHRSAQCTGQAPRACCAAVHHLPTYRQLRYGYHAHTVRSTPCVPQCLCQGRPIHSALRHRYAGTGLPRQSASVSTGPHSTFNCSAVPTRQGPHIPSSTTPCACRPWPQRTPCHHRTCPTTPPAASWHSGPTTPRHTILGLSASVQSQSSHLTAPKVFSLFVKNVQPPMHGPRGVTHVPYPHARVSLPPFPGTTLA